MTKKVTKDEREYRTLCANIREITKTEHGKDVIWAFLSMCNIYGESFTGNSQTFFYEGKRSVGLEMLQLLEDSDPSLYPRLLLRNQNKSTEKE